MLTELCQELNNWFDENPKDGTKNRFFGTFVIENGTIDLSETNIQSGQYFRIVGSVFNDGVYKYEPDVTPSQEHPETQRPVLINESFDGAVWLMSVPPSVVTLATEIDSWNEKYGNVDSSAMSPFTSESFGGYSYSKSNGSGSNGSGAGGTSSWQKVFENRLKQWRKILP